jgi:hypothetical protein
MKRILAAALLSLMVVGSGPALGRPQLLTGEVAKYNEEKVASEIPWTTNLYNAEMQAYREHKMVFWVHMLGDMKGAT